MLTHNQARSIAEARWGRGGTNSEPTTRYGAFYFCCSGHGGFVIDVACLADEELVAVSHYTEIETATQYRWGRRRVLMHPFRTKSAKVSLMATTDTVRFIMLEEDCDWCLAYIVTGIRHRNKPAKLQDPQRTFDQWIKPRKTA